VVEPVHPFDLTGRTVLVTGGSSGIGRETAVILSELGARVIVTGRNGAQLEATSERLAPGTHRLEPYDLAALDGIPDWVAGLAERYGPLDGLVHAAGIQKTIALRGLSVDALQQTFRTNLDSAIMLAKGFRQKGCCTTGSSIVFVSSIQGLLGTPGTAAYGASKAALIGVTRSLATELAREAIRVNCVAPGTVDSGMGNQMRRAIGEERFAAMLLQYPLGLGTARDVACAAAYLLSDAARWVTGQTLVVDGGFSAQ
jgi:NAD(P)-dependent dehydrogenase (short-subunit alcohol dehydrogenase family)